MNPRNFATISDVQFLKSSLLAPREESRIANNVVIFRSFQVPVEVCCNSAIVSAERDGYFGLRQSLTRDFAEAVYSSLLTSQEQFHRNPLL